MSRSAGDQRCLCGCHVHSFVLAISILGILFSSLGVVLMVWAGFGPLALFPLLQMGGWVLVLWGNRYSIPCFYLPSLFTQIIGTMVFFGFSVGVVVYGTKTLAVGMGLLVVFLGLLLLSVSIFTAYLVEAFFRGYLFLRERNTRTKSLPITVLT
ncbi:hypothetical protein M3Y99_01263100 [Aphelenchoides fujianensis]|nr:hypothetical protein M3Y99_01263100 [Aphelenchoides fujianensis]